MSIYLRVRSIWTEELISYQRKKKQEQNNPKAFIDYSQAIDVYENLEGYIPTKKIKVLIVFDDKIADVKANTNVSVNVTELLMRGTKPNISLAFIPQSSFTFKILKDIRLNLTHYFNMEVPSKKELLK